MLRKSVNIFALVCVSLLLVAIPGKSQSQYNATGTVLGHVQDPSHAAVPGAKVTLHNEQTGINQVYTTGSTGDYIFINQIPDTYDVTVEKSGFHTETTPGLILQVEQTLRQDFTLQVGEVKQEITVQAVAAMLQTDNATIGEVVDSKTMQNLPLNGRDYTTLIYMNAGVIEPNGAIQTSTSFDLHGLNSGWQAAGINGERPGSVSYLIDGLSNTDMFFNKSISLISADAIDEFKLQNGLYSAAYGMGSGQVNVAIKSGSNSLHGTAYDYFQNAALQPASLTTNTLNAINHTHNPVETPFNQNQFGFTLGGPMVFPKLYNGRNKTFWFFAYEGGREFSGGASVSSATVPTAAERQGNFQDWGTLSGGVVTPYVLYDPLTSTGSGATFTRSPFPTTNVLTSDPNVKISPIAQAWLNYFPAPQGTCTVEPSCPNLFGILKSRIGTDTYNGRIDHSLTSRDRLTGTVIVSRDLNYTPSLFPDTSTETTQPSRMVGVDWVRNNSSNTVNDLRVGYDYGFLHNGSTAAFGPNLASGLGFANSPTFPQFFGLPILSFSSDGYNAPGNANDYTQTDNIFEYADNFTWIHGKHTLTFGTDERRYRLTDFDGFTAMGSLTFNGAYTALTPSSAGSPGVGKGNGFADFLMGNADHLTAPVPYASDDFHVRATYWSFFAQDDFRVTPRLTLNLGLAYEIPKPLHSLTNDGSTINLATPGGGEIWASNSITKLVASSSFAPTYYQCCISNELYPSPTKDFAPRVGFAWRPLANNDKLVLRGGYGIYYDTFERFYDGENYDSNLLSLLLAPTYPGVTGQETVSPIAVSTLWEAPIAVTPTTGPVRYTNGIETEWPNNATPYNQQWSLDTQYAVNNNLMLDIGYVGSRGLKLPIQWYFNEAYPPKVFGDVCNSIQDVSLATAANGCAADANWQPIDTRTPFANFSSGSYANSTNEWSNYNALQVRVDKRYSQGLQFTVNYTYSRTLDIFSAIASSESEGPNLVQNGNNLRGDYGPAGTDEPQKLVATALYQVPIGKNQKYNFGKLNWLLGGWNASGIYNVGSGLPYSVLAGSNAVQEGSSKLRANVLGPVTYPKSPLEWFNTADFQSPVIQLGSFGNSGKGIIRGPHMEQLDLSFMKNFPFTERLTLQARADIFNAFSYSYSFRAPHVPSQTITSSPLNASDEVSCTPGPGGPSGGNCAFGSLVSLNGLGAENLWNPRTLQLSLRLIF
jgi:hypothetical protein